MPQYLKDYGERLVELGYRIVPLPPGSKGPHRKGWPKFNPDAAQVRQWYSNGSANDGIGVLAATTPAIDVDILDLEVADLMSQEIDRIFAGQALMTRTGKAPKFLIPFRSDEPFRKLSSSVYTDGTHEHKVEILGDGQQWVAYHIHPDTGKPYQWFDGIGENGIRSVGRADLPVLTRGDAQRVIDAFEVLAANKIRSGKWRLRTTAADRVEKPLTDDPFVDQPVGKSDSEVASLLARHPNADSDYDHWFKVLAAVHHELSDAGRELAYEWSSSSSKHTDEKFDTTWNSLGAYTGRQITLRSLLKDDKPTLAEPTAADLAFCFYAGDEYSIDFAGGPELVEDVLPERGIAMVYGPSGKGKTFWTLDIAFHVHNGARWRDKDVKQGDVMYVAAEAGRGIKKRIQAVRTLHPDWRAPFIADAAPNLSSLTSIQAVRDAACAAGSPAMLIVDTMSASFEGDDSSQKDVAQMIRNLKILADDLQCLVVFVHHTTKDGGSFRGSGVLYNDVDAVLELESTGEGAERKQWVTQRKHREGEDGKSYPFRLVISEPLAFKPNGKPVTSCTIEQESYKPEPKKEGRKSRSGDFETAENYRTARIYLHIIEELVGLGDANVDENDVISAIQSDPELNPMGYEDKPAKRSIQRTLHTLGEKGKITKEGRWIRVCRNYHTLAHPTRTAYTP